MYIPLYTSIFGGALIFTFANMIRAGVLCLLWKGKDRLLQEKVQLLQWDREDRWASEGHGNRPVPTYHT